MPFYSKIGEELSSHVRLLKTSANMLPIPKQEHICQQEYRWDSVQISDSDVDNIVTLYHLRHASGHPADDT